MPDSFLPSTMSLRCRPALAAVAVAVVAASSAAVPTSAGAAAPSCRSGDTVHRAGGVRIFVVERDEQLYACRPGSSRPVFLTYYSPTYTTLAVGARRGSVLAFIATTSGEGGGCDAEVGWFDARTGRRGIGDAFLSDVCPELLDVAVAKDRTTAVVAHVVDEPGNAVVSLHTPGRGRRLGKGRPRAFVRGAYAKGSLELSAGAITWRDGDGARRVPRAGEPDDCAAGRTKLAIGSVRIFEAIDRAKDEGVLKWCSTAVTSPRTLPKQQRYGGVVGGLTPSPEDAGRVAFTGAGIAGIADGGAGTVRALSLSASRPFKATALGPSGELVAVYDPQSGRLEGGVVVLGPGPDPTTFAKAQLIATIRDALTDKAPFTVADGAVTFTTRSGSRTVPLTGEPAATCAAGTTIGARDGVRLFEVLDVPAQTRALLACRGADPAATPLRLLTQPLPRPFPASLLGVRTGRGVVLHAGATRDAGDTVFTFETTQESVRSGRTPRDGRAIGYLDAAVAPDGAVAYLLGAAKTEAYVMTPTATGLATARRVAARDGGYAARSLTIDDTHVAWRTKRGATLRVSRPAP